MLVMEAEGGVSTWEGLSTLLVAKSQKIAIGGVAMS